MIISNFDHRGRFLDYAGGFGVFVRMMRDYGFDYYWDDKYCKNIFAKYFTINDIDMEYRRIELVTAFEVLEHLYDPTKELNEIFQHSDSLLFSTEIQPEKNLDKWWYLSPETGQHLTFYTIKALNALAEKHNCKFYSNNKNLHIISKRNLKENIFNKDKDNILSRIFSCKNKKLDKKVKIDSLLQRDYEYVKDLISHTKKCY